MGNFKNMDNKELSSQIIVKNKSLWELIKFTTVSLLTSLVEISIFSLLNFLVFISLSSVDFKLGPLDYSVSNGGLSAFLAFSISYIFAQIFNFFMQRKVTFDANNKVLSSAIMYTIMIIFIFILQMYIPTLIYLPISNLVGNDLASLMIKSMMMFLAFVIQFPINKWVIMRKST
jgi:putative flippase GtrA